MECTKCGKVIGIEGELAYQVRIGYCEHTTQADMKSRDEFLVEDDVGYYCSECLTKGV